MAEGELAGAMGVGYKDAHLIVVFAARRGFNTAGNINTPRRYILDGALHIGRVEAASKEQAWRCLGDSCCQRPICLVACAAEGVRYIGI
jgi:hypothetical protein